MSIKQSLRAEKLSRLLRTSEHDYSVSTGMLLYLSPHELNAMIDYVERTPRVTSYGRTITREDAARIVGVSLNSGNDVRLAMKFDSPNTGEFEDTLWKCGLSGAMDDASDEQTQRIAAVLYAYDRCFLELDTPEGFQLEVFHRYMGLIYKNPTQVTHLTETSITRKTLDGELIELVQKSPSRALDEGTL